MNKDVIYIEPEDDITDIITKIESSEQKIVALVPPKKAGVFRSIVNIKLIAKSGSTAKKQIVLVTTDPSIIKLAAAAKLPVTKNLQTAPSVPELSEDLATSAVSREKVDENAEQDVAEDKNADSLRASQAVKTDTEDGQPKSAENADESGEESADDLTGKTDTKASEKRNNKKSGSKEKNGLIGWIIAHKPVVIAGAAALVTLIIFFIWGFILAPAATITIGIRTTTNNFSENVAFTNQIQDEDASAGTFYLSEQKIESKSEVEFEATGSKNVGEKASGNVIIYAYFRDKSSVAINAGTVFTIDGLNYISSTDASLSWDGNDISACNNQGQSTIVLSGCLISGRVTVAAEHSGAEYNISAAQSGWNTTANVNVYSDSAITGGTDKTITVVSKKDIEAALAKISTENEAVNKEKLLDSLKDKGDDLFVIDASFKQTTGDAVSTPALGEEVKEGEKAVLSVVTTDSIYTIDLTKVKEFITEKAKLAENYKIYSMNDPFIENFMETETGYVGKLKTSYVSGPEVTENKVIEIVKGKGFGTAQHDLGDLNGISSITIDGSLPWVTTVPNDPEKITVNINVEESH